MNIQLESPRVTREQALEIAERATELLKTRFGATRVIVFGSARGDAPWHEGSDLDLAVEGLPKENFWDAYGAVENLMERGLDFDLVEVDKVPPELQARIRGEIDMPKDPVLALKSIVSDKLKSLERIVTEADEEYSKIEDYPNRALMRGMASYVHDFYQAAESIFERVVVYLDGGVPQGPDWHKNLLNLMYQKIPDVRPALVTDDVLYARLSNYLGFRHIFRKAYQIELEWDKLEANLIGLHSTLEMLRAQLDTFFIELARMKSDEQ